MLGHFNSLPSGFLLTSSLLLEVPRLYTTTHITCAKVHFPDGTIPQIITQEVEDDPARGPGYLTIEMAWLDSREWTAGGPTFQSVIMMPKNSRGSKHPAMMEDENQNLGRASYAVRSTGHTQRERIDSQAAGPDLCRIGPGKGKVMIPGG